MMAQWLQASVVLAEDLGSVSSAHMAVNNSNSRGSNNLFWALENVNNTYIDASKMLIKEDLKVHFENE